MTVVRLIGFIPNGRRSEVNQKPHISVVLSRVRTWTLAFAFVLLLASCGTQKSNVGGPSERSNFDTIPANIGQALAVTAAEKELGITPQTAEDMWVVSTLIHDPLMRPAFWANLIVKGNQPQNFRGAVAAAEDKDPIYFSGAATNRTFHGDIMSAKVFKLLYQACSECRLVHYAHAVYGVKGQDWFDPSGERVSPEGIAEIKRVFSAVAKSVEDGDIPREMAKRWKRLLEESPQGVPSPVGNSVSESEVMNIGTQFFKPGVSAQHITDNTCLSSFFWSCTVRRISGNLAHHTSYLKPDGSVGAVDWGNYQFIGANDWGQKNLGWNTNPNQNYSNPFAAPSQVGTGVWGDWDSALAGLKDSSQYTARQYLVGCGPMTVARLLDWARFAGMLSSYTLKLPNNNLSFSGHTVTFNSLYPSGEENSFLKLVFWPVKVGTKNINGVNKDVYSGWLSDRIGASHFNGQTTASTAGMVNGANTWFADNNWTERLVGAYSRDFDLVNMTSTLLPPVINFVWWSQATWNVNGTLKNSIGATYGQDMPAIVLYQTNLWPVSVNGIRLGLGHYGISDQFQLFEYWDWSENYAWVNFSRGDLPYWSGGNRVYLSDYYDMTFGAFRLQRQ